MPDHRPNKGWLLFFGGLLVLALAYSGYGRWRHFQLAKALHNSDPVIRINAAREAAKANHADLLVEALLDEDPDVRYVAIYSLGAVASNDRQRVQGLLEALKDDHANIRKEAIRILKHLPAGVRHRVYKGVEDEDSRVRSGTAYALVYLPKLGITMSMEEPPTRPAKDREVVVALMTGLLKDDDVEVRKAAAFCLFSYHLETEEALRVRSALEEGPKETDQDARDLADRLMRAAIQQSQ
jgi:HEAT repeat protein